MAEFKDRLRELRKKRGLTQQELADLIGKTESIVRKYENGTSFPRVSAMSIKQWEGEKRKPQMDSIIDIALFFNVTTDYLLGLTDNSEPIRNQLSDYSTDELMKEVMKRWL